MKKKYLILIFFICFSNKQINAASIDKKETLYLFKVSFLSINQNNDSIFKKEFLLIEQLFKENQIPESLEKALHLLNKNINSEIRFETLFLIAEIYRLSNSHSKSILYYKKAKEELKSVINSVSKDLKQNKLNETQQIRIDLLLGSGYLFINQIDSAKFYYNNSLKIQTLDTMSLSYQASASNNLSGIYLRDSLYDLAKEFAYKAIDFHEKRNNKISEAAAKGNLANIFLEQNYYKEAKETYKEALELIKNDKSDRAERIKENLYYNLAYNLYKLKDYEAYVYQELSYNIKDTLRDREIRSIIEETGFKYNFDREKVLLEKEQELKLLEQKDKVNTIVVVSVLILIILLLIITYYILTQKNLQIQLTKTELLQTQNLEKLKSDSQVRILNATIDGKESERKEIAETLHDSVSALLSSANLHLQASRKQFKGEVPLEIDKSQKIINEASDKIRDLSHSLMSSVLLKFGLNFAIKDIAEKYSNSELSIDTQISQLRRYDQNFEIKTHNIIQEFVNNILKHSKAENAFIKLKESDGSLILVISDDGIGFNKKKAVTKDGLGLNQIDARIKMMKGKFKIITSKNNGTVIKVELPILEREFN
ncbi:MAG: histidine kinase [Polaribacter sp.]|nr:histidine kinase [Polaribacter sp.]